MLDEFEVILIEFILLLLFILHSLALPAAYLLALARYRVGTFSISKVLIL